MLFNEIYAYYFSGLIALCILFTSALATGYVFKLNSYKPLSNYIISLACALCILVSLFGVYLTHGKTILWGGLAVVGLYLFQLRKQNLAHASTIDFSFFKNFMLNVVLYTLCFAFSACTFYFKDAGIFYNSLGDHYAYSLLGNIIKHTHIENAYYYTSFGKQFEGTALYHYYDIYFSSIISFPFRLNNLFTYSITANALMSSFVMLGLCALLQQRVRWRQVYLVFVFLFIHFTGFVLPLYYFEKVNPILIGAFDFPYLSAANFLRSSCMSLYVILFVLAYKKELRFWTFTPLLLLPYINIVTLPGIAGGLALLMLLYFIFERKGCDTPYFRFALLFVLAMIYFSVFSLLTGSAFGVAKLIITYKELSFYIYYFLCIGKYSLRILIFYFPVFIFLWWYFSQGKFSFKLIFTEYLMYTTLAVILLVSLLTACILWQNYDGMQAFTNLAREVMLTLLVLVAAFAIKKFNNLRGVFKTGIVVILIWFVINAGYNIFSFNLMHNHPQTFNQCTYTYPYLQLVRNGLNAVKINGEMITCAVMQHTINSIPHPVSGNIDNDLLPLTIYFKQYHPTNKKVDWKELYTRSPMGQYFEKFPATSQTDSLQRYRDFLQENKIKVTLDHNVDLSSRLYEKSAWTFVSTSEGGTIFYVHK
ncbi:MAG: hypothetical protein IPO27_02400 [Bacteroidetes bacterium]|nr:hypothetical protein [Bacteroidota bacterium]